MLKLGMARPAQARILMFSVHGNWLEQGDILDYQTINVILLGLSVEYTVVGGEGEFYYNT